MISYFLNKIQLNADISNDAAAQVTLPIETQLLILGGLLMGCLFIVFMVCKNIQRCLQNLTREQQRELISTSIERLKQIL